MTPRLRDMPIRRKLTLVIMLTSATSLVLACAAFLAWDLLRFRAELQRDVETQAAIVADNSTAALAFADPEAAGDTLAALRAKPEIEAAAIYDATGTLFAEYRRGAGVAPLPPRAGRDASRFEPGQLLVYRPVDLSGRRIGTVHLRASTSGMYDRLLVQGTAVGVVLFGAALIALLLSSALQRVISGPVMSLATAAAAVAARSDYSRRARKHGDDELGQLVDAFNAMLAAIEARDAELLRANERLEARVAERTEQLERELAERRRAERQLERRNEELARTNRDLDDFAYIASHDLREPLRGIHNYAQFLLEDHGSRLDEDGRAKLETLVRLSRRMELLIDSLLHFSRVGRLTLGRTPVDTNELVQEVLESMAVTLREAHAEVRIPRPLPPVRCDASRVAEVFQNLISNGVKYNDKCEKWVEVGTLDDGDLPAAAGGQSPVFYVRDNGIGIPQKHLDTVFRIFKRLHARDRFGGGTGAGLTIVKKIVERHSGRVWIDSVPGQQTTVYFTLGKDAHA